MLIIVYTFLNEATNAMEIESIVDCVLQLEDDILREMTEKQRRLDITVDLEHWELRGLEEVRLLEFDQWSETIRY